MKPGVVIVDPNVDSIHKLTQLLKTNGKSILATSSEYDESEQLIHHHTPTIAFVGLQENPDAGMQTIRKIRELSPKTNVIVTSLTDLDAQIIKQCKEMNIVGITRYPFHKINKLSEFNTEPVRREIRENRENKVMMSGIKGNLVCVGYAPGSRDWAMLSSAGLGYLGFHNFHIAMNYFKQRTSNVVMLIIRQSVEFKSDPTKSLLIREELVDKDNRAVIEKKIIYLPWQEAIRHAQLQYQEYWKEAVTAGMLPQILPCFVYHPESQTLRLIPEVFIESLEIKLVEGRKTFRSYPQGNSTEELYFNNLVNSLGQSLIQIEPLFPHLFPMDLSSKRCA